MYIHMYDQLPNAVWHIRFEDLNESEEGTNSERNSIAMSKLIGKKKRLEGYNLAMASWRHALSISLILHA
jgi:hypothetical protein